MADLLQIKDLSVSFELESGEVRAVQNLSVSIRRGEILALVGESGSGKSVTALSILQLLPAPPARYASGQILFHDAEITRDLLKTERKILQTIRGNRIAMIFQEPMTALNPVHTCGKQVAEALMQHKQVSFAEAKRRAIEWFDKVKLPQPSEMFRRYPHQLSGGQKQRVMIAMAMCCNPSLLICDEPTTALDVTVQKTILELIADLQKENGMGVVFITHDLGIVAEIADRVAIMYRGEKVEEGDCMSILRSPQHPYTKALIACRPSLHPKGEKLPVVADFLNSENVQIKKATAPIEKQPAQKEALVQVDKISVHFTQKSNLFGKTVSRFTAVNEVSFDILKGETLGLVGESGCGKTTLGRTLLGMVPSSSGRILYNGNDITTLDKKGWTHLRKNVQLVFQDPYSSLNPRLNIADAIGEPMKVNGLERNAAQRRKKVSVLLDKVSMPSSAMSRYPHEFSGGQRQRIVIARALALEPSFLVCDESVSALDVSVQAQVLNLLNDLKKDLGLTMLFISHDLSVVRYMSDRILVMEEGKIVESGEAELVYTKPQSPYTQKLLAAIPERTLASIYTE